VGDEAPVPSVRQQAEDVLHIIQYGSKRREICTAVRREDIKRDELTLSLDELHILALKPAVMAIEPKSAAEIGRMKTCVMSSKARPGPMARVADTDLFAFIAGRLMALDATLAEESVVDEEFATFLTRSNTIQKALNVAVTRTNNKARGPDETKPQRRKVPKGPDKECPKCHFIHPLRECTAEYATLSRNGARNLNWLDKPGYGRPRGGGGRGAPYGARPAILPA
jgi:hypothetical protein